jgi:hypothetical protein
MIVKATFLFGYVVIDWSGDVLENGLFDIASTNIASSSLYIIGAVGKSISGAIVIIAENIGLKPTKNSYKCISIIPSFSRSQALGKIFILII